ncbi:MAG: PorT family protein, partial [Taibaiella sp.]|nr:PorT family protein [Taibaiella sp.]
MKKFLLLVCAFLPIMAFAQPGPLEIDLGIKAGMNFTRMAGKTWSGGYRSGVLGGAFASLGVKKIGAQAEVLVATTSFTGNGSSFKSAGLLLTPNDSTSTGSFSATYLNIPVLLNLKLFGNAMIQLGPQFVAPLSLKDKDGVLNQPATNIFNTSDIAGVVGLQLNLPLKLNAGVRYTFGLTDQNVSSVGESWK